VGFGEYLGAFLPFFSTGHVVLSLPLAGKTLALNGGQVAGVLAIAFLTAVNYVGLRAGAGVQNVVTVAKIGALLALGGLGLLVPAKAEPDVLAPLAGGAGALSAFGVAMIGVLWTYDGWYATTNLAGEMRHPGRDLPRALFLGTALITVLYVLVNVVYLRALPVSEMPQTGRIGEAAATVLFGRVGGRLLTAAVLVSTFGCISSTILYAARIYQPMAEDGVFFRGLARIHPRHRTPSASILAQGAWAALLTCSGTYEQLYTFAIFAVVLFHAMTGAAVILLRRTRPDADRPYRVPAYPWLPLVFVVTSLVLVVNTILERPLESLAGLVLILAGLPAFAFWRRQASRPLV
jgi:APA family basic amino acid/polyamine antiporter